MANQQPGNKTQIASAKRWIIADGLICHAYSRTLQRHQVNTFSRMVCPERCLKAKTRRKVSA